MMGMCMYMYVHRCVCVCDPEEFHLLLHVNVCLHFHTCVFVNICIQIDEAKLSNQQAATCKQWGCPPTRWAWSQKAFTPP